MVNDSITKNTKKCLVLEKVRKFDELSIVPEDSPQKCTKGSVL